MKNVDGVQNDRKNDQNKKIECFHFLDIKKKTEAKLNETKSSLTDHPFSIDFFFAGKTNDSMIQISSSSS